MPTPGLGIGNIKTEAQLEAFVRHRLAPELARAMRQGVYLRLAAQGNYTVKWGSVPDVFAGNLAANATGAWTPTPGALGFNTLAAAALGLVPQTSATGVRVVTNDITSHAIQVLNGATPQLFTGTYLAVGI